LPQPRRHCARPGIYQGVSGITSGNRLPVGEVRAYSWISCFPRIYATP